MDSSPECSSEGSSSSRRKRFTSNPHKQSKKSRRQSSDTEHQQQEEEEEEPQQLQQEQQEEPPQPQQGRIKGVKRSRLYYEILALYKERFEGRLKAIVDGIPGERAREDRTIIMFEYHLAKESLTALRDDSMILSDDSYQKLTEICVEQNVPVEEMVAAFLQSTQDKNVFQYPFKSLQEYLAGFYIWSELTHKSNPPDKSKLIETVLDYTITVDVPPRLIDWVIKMIKKEDVEPFDDQGLSYTIRKILEELSISATSDISKYQNVFKYALGLCFHGKQEIKDRFMVELKKLLQMAGVTETDDWVAVVNDIELNHMEIINFFTEKQDLTGDIKVTDSSLMAYNVLLKAKGEPMNDPSVKVSIHIKEELEDVETLFRLISHHCLTVEQLEVNPSNCKLIGKYIHDPNEPALNPQLAIIHLNEKEDINVVNEVLQFCNDFDNIRLDMAWCFRNSYLADQDIRDAIDSTLQRYQQKISIYVGPMTDSLEKVLGLVRYAWIGVNKLEELQKLSTMLETIEHHNLEKLELCVDSVAYAGDPIPVSPMNGVPILHLYLPDVEKETAPAALEIAKKLMPTDPQRGYHKLYYPRLQCFPAIVVMNFEGVEVTEFVVLPTAHEPRNSAKRKLKAGACERTGCIEITWGGLDIDSF